MVEAILRSHEKAKMSGPEKVRAKLLQEKYRCSACPISWRRFHWRRELLNQWRLKQWSRFLVHFSRCCILIHSF